MQETNSDKVTLKDATQGAQQGGHDALINRVAQEMASNNNNLLTFDKAPENAMNRYGMAAVKGIGNIPQGVVNAVIHDVKNPVETLETLGMGAGFAVVLKTVLPEGGMAGKIAGAALGTYFAVEAAKPIVAGFKQAGAAATMSDLNAASVQIGDAGGAFLVNSAIAAGGYKIGGALTDRALAMPAAAGFNAAKAGFYDNLSAKVTPITDALGITKAPLPQGEMKGPFNPQGYGVIPPHLLESMAKADPKNVDFLRTYKATVDMQSQPTSGIRPSAGTDFKGAREVYDAQTKESLPGKKARFEGEKATGNAEVDNAYDYTGFIKDFYQKEYARNSIDGKGMKLVSTVNYGQNYENAFWNGSQMTYGHPGAESPFKTFMLLDVAGHEITHGVTEMESGLQYQGQSGALNESLSDVFGNLIKQYAEKQTADKADWLVGGGIWKDNIKGRALRDMLNPGTAYDDPSLGKDPQPAHMKDYYKTWGDNGGVHYNSGIPNKAFATFANAVGGHAWEDPGHIWYNARKMAGSTPSFGQFAYYTVEAAKAMGKTDLIPKLEKAWDGVGVKPDINATDTQTPVRPADAQIAPSRLKDVVPLPIDNRQNKAS